MVESDLCVSLILPPALALLQGEIFCHPLHIMKFLTPSPLVGEGWDGGIGLEHRCFSGMTALITPTLPLPHSGGGDLTPSIVGGCEKPLSQSRDGGGPGWE